MSKVLALATAILVAGSVSAWSQQTGGTGSRTGAGTDQGVSSEQERGTTRAQSKSGRQAAGTSQKKAKAKRKQPETTGSGSGSRQRQQQPQQQQQQ
jgi:hypothetical protein